MDAESKRKRAVNFTEAEKVILTDLVFRYKNIIENKRTDAITSKDKDKTWKVIEQLFNSTCSTEFRSSEVLKSCWDNLKKKTRKFFADEKMKLYKTGGGPCESRSDTLMDRVREIIKSSVDGLTNTFDSDAITETSANLYKTSEVSNISKYNSPIQNKGLCTVAVASDSCITSKNTMTTSKWPNENTIVIRNKNDTHNAKMIQSKKNITNNDNINVTNTNNAYEANTYKDNTYEDNIYEDNTYEDNIYENNTYEDNTYENNTYEDNTYEDNMYKDSHQIEILNYLKEKYAVGTQKDCLQDISNKQKDANYRKSDINKNQNVGETDDNENILCFDNNNDKHSKEKDNPLVQKSQKRNLPKISAVQILKNKISIPLQGKRKTSSDQSNLENDNKRCKLPKRKENSSSSKVSSRMSVFNILAESKTELVQFMKEDLQKKSEVEVQILNMQLKKEELEVQLLEKELLLKEHILKKELQK